jgi:hypothetical protein
MSDELSHYGKKGMKWGVINEDDTTSKSNKSNKSAKPSTSKVTKDEYIEALKARPKHTKAEQEKLIAKDKEKFKAKFEQSGQKTQDETKPKKGWRPTKQQLAIAGIGAAYVGLVAASMYVENKGPSYQFQSAPKVADILRNPVFSKPGKLAISAGEHCSVSQYSSLIDGSISRSWGGRYFNDYSWERPELSFPAGHVFHRLSHGMEASFSQGGTYCTTSKEELARYLASGEFGGLRSHITWQSTQEVRVPKLETALEAAKTALSSTSGKKNISTKKALDWYSHQTGGGWNPSDPNVASFFSALKSMGYHAIIDEMDAGVFSENPLVWFDSAVATPKQTSKLTKADLEEARSILTEIAHRK